MAILVDIEKKLGNFHLKVHLESESGILTLLGASGCGKSMTLKCIAGIEKPDRGRIILDGVTLFDSEKKIDLAVQKRKVGLLFQNYALFPNMTVEQNVRAGAAKLPKAEQKKTVQEMLERFEIAQLSQHYPHQLSGGQKQRAALARLMASRPKLLLLDEPFSALDSHLRLQIQQQMTKQLRAFENAVIMVTHDRDEAYRMSDTIALMQDGRITRMGNKKEVFSDPQTVKNAVITGCRNIAGAEIADHETVFVREWGIQLNLLPDSGRFLSGTKKMAVGIHSIDFHVGKGDNTFICRVDQVIENVHSDTLLLRPKDAETGCFIYADVPGGMGADSAGEWIEISVSPEAVMLLKDGE